MRFFFVLIASNTNILQKQFFRTALAEWYAIFKRPLPWRETRNPYHIWLSEIILQQTRVVQGLPYYEKFVNQYPKVEDLAKAPQEEVLKLWEGLGYYSRARNMHQAAKYIAHERNGDFPPTYQEILKIKGVGPYTAAAIASFAFEEPQAVVDGNVYRVLARIFGVEEAVNTPKAQKVFKTLADGLLNRENPSEYNQAIMEFGALQCVPKKPDCTVCPFKEHCYAFLKGAVEALPKKAAKKAKKQRFFYYLQLQQNGSTLVRERPANDIWEGLYEFVLLEFETPRKVEEVLEKASGKGWLTSSFVVKEVVSLKPHLLSHQKLWVQVLKIETERLLFPKGEGAYRKVNKEELSALPMPILLRKYLDQNQLPLPF